MKFCERPFKHAHLARDGEVWPCAWMHCTIGNLNEQTLGEMWHSEGAEQARDSYFKRLLFLLQGDLMSLFRAG